MDLTARLLRFAAGRPRPLVLSAVGGTAVRLAVEREVRRAGWPPAASPAEADLLVLAGDPASLQDVPVRLWQAMGAPRARVELRTVDDVVAGLAAGARALGDVAGQRSLAARRRGVGAAGSEPESGDGHHHGDGSGEMASMQLPGGLPMADRAADRDGLRLDQLHLPLGPGLADWPSGLVIRVALQGDVIQHAEVEPARTAVRAAAPFWDEPWMDAADGHHVVACGQAARRRAAAHLDSAGRLLAVAGWPDAAARARVLRDELLGGAASTRVAGRIGRLARRVTGSRTLRWLTAGLGILDARTAAAAGVTGPALAAAGDVPVRLVRWLTGAAVDAGRLADDTQLAAQDRDGPRGRLIEHRPPSAALLAVLPGLLEGAELAAARLIVASFDPDLDELTGVPVEPADG